MDADQKKCYLFLMIGFITAVVVILYVTSLRIQLQEVRANQNHYEKEINPYLRSKTLTH